MWQINSKSINSVCKSWNKGVRRILNLPHDAHTWLLGPLLKQNHIKIKIKIKKNIFYFRSKRPIDRTCITMVKI